MVAGRGGAHLSQLSVCRNTLTVRNIELGWILGIKFSQGVMFFLHEPLEVAEVAYNPFLDMMG